MDQKYIVALELSGSQVKGALASVSTNQNGMLGIPVIEAIVTEDVADCVQYGRVQNVLNAAKYTNMVMQRLENEPALNGGTINGVYVALAGRSLASEKASAEINLPSEMVITTEVLRNLFVEASKMAAPNRQVLKVLPRKYVVDSQAMANPVGALGSRLRGDFTLVTSNPTNQRNLDLVAADKSHVNLSVKGYKVTPLAIADMVLDEEAKQLGCVLVDIGFQTLTISIYKDRALQYLATLPMGSQNITRDISVGLNWTLEKAEKLKCTQGDAMPEHTRGTDEVSRMNALVAARAYEMVANINANLDYANYKAADLPEGIILVGRGARLHNLDNLLAAQTKMRVRYANMPKNINFGPATRNLHPEDYMSLISIVLQICHKNDFPNCVTPQTPQEPVVVVAEPEKTDAPAVQQQPTARAQSTETQTHKQVDEDKWAEDDPDTHDETPQRPEKPKKKGLIQTLKDKWAVLMEPSDLDDDATL